MSTLKKINSTVSLNSINLSTPGSSSSITASPNSVSRNQQQQQQQQEQQQQQKQKQQQSLSFTISFDNDAKQNNRNFFNMKKNSLLDFLNNHSSNKNSIDNNNDNNNNQQSNADAKYSFNLQEAFRKYREYKIEETKLKQKTQNLRKSYRTNPERMWRLRLKFIEQAKKYFGVPYARKYFSPDSEEYQSKLFLDCCGLVRRVMRDLEDDFGFRIGPGNQAYMFDTLPKTIEKLEDVKPGDLVFISGVYYNQNMKKQPHNMTHVEIMLADGEKTIGARWNNGKVQVFNSYKFESKSFHSAQYYFKSLDPWLMGFCRSFCSKHTWPYNTIRPNPKPNSIFSPYHDTYYSRHMRLKAKKMNESNSNSATMQGGGELKKKKKKKKKSKSSNNRLNSTNRNSNLLSIAADTTTTTVTTTATMNDSVQNGAENRLEILESVDRIYQDCKAAIETDYEYENELDNDDDEGDEQADSQQDEDVAAEEYVDARESSNDQSQNNNNNNNNNNDNNRHSGLIDERMMASKEYEELYEQLKNFSIKAVSVDDYDYEGL